MTAKQPSNPSSVVAAFDFDGTITKRDTLLSFLTFAAGKWETTKKLLVASPQLLGFLCGIVSRQAAKETVLEAFFHGMPLEQLKELGEAFAQSPALSRLIYPTALKRFEWHRSQNHRCILISASIDVYLDPWRRRLGFHDLLCSRLETDVYGIVTGRLKGANCWGPEKARRLEELLGPRENYLLYAYGDSRGDQEMLSLADYSFYRKMS